MLKIECTGIRKFSNNTARAFVALALTDPRTAINLCIKVTTLYSRQSRLWISRSARRYRQTGRSVLRFHVV